MAKIVTCMCERAQGRRGSLRQNPTVLLTLGDVWNGSVVEHGWGLGKVLEEGWLLG